MVRHVDSADFDFNETIYGRGLWLSVAEEIAKEHLPPSHPAIPEAARLVMAEGILQHYGFRTHYVDVTFNPDIALCFAHFRYHDLYPVFDGHDPAKVRRVAWYWPSEESHGYVYVLDCLRWRPSQGAIRHGEVIDLTNLVRPGWNRVQMQQAMVVHSNPHKAGYGDLRPLVRVIFRFPVPLPGAEETLDRETGSWFPDPKHDPIYRSLLQSKFVRQTYIADREIRALVRIEAGTHCTHLEAKFRPFAEIDMYRRALDIPEYHDPESVEHINRFRRYDRTLEPTFYFLWLKANMKAVEFVGPAGRRGKNILKKIAHGGAILINAPFADLKEVPLGVTKTPYVPAAAELNQFLEFNPFNFSGPYADDGAVRGIWIGGTSQRLSVTVFGAAEGKPWVGDFGTFEWTDEGYEASAGADSGMRSYFLLALKLLRDMAEGRAEVSPLHEDLGYQQMRYPIDLPKPH
jgi:hypothetical protein